MMTDFILSESHMLTFHTDSVIDKKGKRVSFFLFLRIYLSSNKKSDIFCSRKSKTIGAGQQSVIFL